MSEGRRFPERPAIPASLYALVAVMCVERWTLAAGEVGPWLWALAAFGAVVFVVTVARTLRGRDAWPCEGTLMLVGGAVLASTVLSAVTLWAGGAFAHALATRPVSSVSFVITADPTQTRYGWRCRARCAGKGLGGGEVWLSCETELERGDLVRGVGRFAPLGEDEWGRSSRMQGLWGSVRLVRVTQRRLPSGLLGATRRLRDAARATLCPDDSEGGALLAGCVIADRRALAKSALDQLFGTCGVAHLVAVSGSHLAVVTALVNRFFARLRLAPAPRTLLLALLTGAFVAVCGAPPSALRAWGMAQVGATSALFGRRSDALSAVCVVALSLALLEPSLSGQLGFVLSVCCVVGLALFARYAAYLLDALVPRLRLPRATPSELRIRLGGERADIVDALSASLVAQLVALPVVCPVFARLSFVGPVAALVVTPLLTAAMTCALVACCLSFVPLVSKVLLVPGSLLASVVLWLLRWLAALPYASVPLDASEGWAWLVLVMVAIALLVFWPRPSRCVTRGLFLAVLAALSLAFVLWRFCAPARVVVLDVGQGDAILVQEGSHAVLVDAGPDSSVVKALARKHVLHLDGIVITHLHDDHYGGVLELAGSIPCDRVVVARGVTSHIPDALGEAIVQLTGCAPLELSYGDTLKVGGFDLKMVWPRAPVTGEQNADSIELLLSYAKGDCSFLGLLTGDAERDETGAILEAGDVGDIDFLKVGHHGSEVSLTQNEARLLHPELAVASAGEGNAYGHPKEECIRMLEEVGARFICTKDVGDVELRPCASGVRVIMRRRPIHPFARGARFVSPGCTRHRLPLRLASSLAYSYALLKGGGPCHRPRAGFCLPISLSAQMTSSAGRRRRG